MSLIEIRKRSLTIETIHHEGGAPVATPLRLAAACAVVRNPYAGRYEPDLMPFMAELRALGTLLAEELVGVLRPPPPTLFALRDARQAHTLLDAGQTLGKLVLLPQR